MTAFEATCLIAGMVLALLPITTPVTSASLLRSFALRAAPSVICAVLATTSLVLRNM